MTTELQVGKGWNTSGRTESEERSGRLNGRLKDRQGRWQRERRDLRGWVEKPDCTDMLKVIVVMILIMHESSN